ncbi:hypothetical protein AC578_3289 [Pseudocercospora eumusae]|uniref:NADH dehydrogenase [ubiquinone] 1 alpha subcomplex subunit 1 n=1 Tax=Pseudocercospora eumusae TaxID=321146 RepID=A0A139HCI9_9PEZI|nr:hypothetical protein AC578_3289 [Pseudocercospora eumusae]
MPLTFFSLTGAGLSKIRHMQNGGKRPRHSVDQWDKQMMDRDRRLTGFLRGQTDNAIAPKGFELSNPWRHLGLTYLREQLRLRSSCEANFCLPAE